MSATSTTGRAALVAANGRARRPAEPPQGELSHAEALRGGERRDFWFGEVPDGWEVKRLASYFSERKVKVSDKDFPPLSVTKNGILPQLENVAKTDDGDNRKLVRKGDFVINSRSDRKGSSGLSEYDGSVSLINLVLKPRGGLFGAYCNYLLKSLSFVEENYRNGRGIVADLWTTRYDEMKMIKVAMPPLPEQKAIVAYLDAETGRIDKAIAAEEKMIALLQERREIVINEAVRGGDLSHAEAQRGRERRGWDVVQLKRIVDTPITDGPHETPTFVDGDGIPFVSAEASHDGRIFLNECRGLILRKDHERFCQKVRPRRNDIFIVKSGSTTGKVVMVDFDEEFSIWSPLALVRVSRRANTRFVFYCLMSQGFQQQVKDNWSFGTQPNIGMSAIARLVIPLPPLPEQEAIVERLDRETGKIDRAIEVKRRQIELLRERRQIVIDEVVTGKVKVA